MEIDKELLLKESEEPGATLHDFRETGRRLDDSAFIYDEGKYKKIERIPDITENKNAPEAATSKGNGQ